MSRLSDVGQFDLNKMFADLDKGLTQVQQVAAQVEQAGTTASRFVKDPVATAIKSITFYTNYSPEKTYTGAQIAAKLADKKPNPIGKLIQPTIIIETPLGKNTLAPYGPADVGFWKANVAQVVLLAGSVLLLYSTGIFVWGRHVGRKGG